VDVNTEVRVCNTCSTPEYRDKQNEVVVITDLIVAKAPFRNINTGLTLATANTQTSKNIGIHLNYLDIVKLNNPTNIKNGRTLFGITGTNTESTPTPQAGVVIHDGDSTTICPFYGSVSALNAITWTVSDTGVDFSDGQVYTFKGGPEGAFVHGLSTKDDNTVDTDGLTINSSGGVLRADQVLEYWVVYVHPAKVTIKYQDAVIYEKESNSDISIHFSEWEDHGVLGDTCCRVVVDGVDAYYESWLTGYYLSSQDRYFDINDMYGVYYMTVPVGSNEEITLYSL
jgi:hypothetical protein